MRIRHDPTTGALYFRIREGEIAETLELPTPGAYMDVDEAGNVMGLEFLSLPEFLFFIDSRAEGEAVLPDRVEPDAFIEATEQEARRFREMFKEWIESDWQRHLEHHWIRRVQ